MTEVILVAGTVAALYFAAYLYEIGFLWHLGFSRSLAIIAVAAPAGCILVACALPVRATARGGPTLGDSHVLSALTLGALGVCVIALLGDAIRQHFIDTALVAYGDGGLGVAKSLVLLGGIVSLALFQRHAVALFARSEPGRIALSSLLLLLLFTLPVALGWRGADQKESRAASFLYLAGSDFALVRLYTDKAVFLRYDRDSGEFGSEYRVRHFDDGGEDEITRDLEMR